MNANALAHTLIYDRDPFSRPVSKRSRLSHKRSSDQTISETKFDSVVEAIADENGENNAAEAESPPPHEEPKRKLRNQRSLDMLDGSYIARENAGHAIRYLSKPPSLEASDTKQTGTGSFEQESKDLETAGDHTSINGDNDDNSSSSQMQNGRSYNTSDTLPGEVTVSVLHDAIIPIIMPFMFCSDKIRYPEYKDSLSRNSFYSSDRNDDTAAPNGINDVESDDRSGRRMSNYKDFLYLACSHDNPPDPSDQDVPADSNVTNDSMQTCPADSEHLDIETADGGRSSSKTLKEIPTAVDQRLPMTSLPEEALIEESDNHLVSKHEIFQELNPEDCSQDININADEIHNPGDNIEQSLRSTEPSIDVRREAIDRDAQITTDNNIFPNQAYSNSGVIENISRPDITHVSDDVSSNKADRHDKAQEGENTEKSDTVSSPTDNATEDAEKLKGVIKEASHTKPSEGGAMSRFKNFFGGKKAPTQKKEDDDSDKSQINIDTSKNLTNDAAEDAPDSSNNDNSHLERLGPEPDKHKIQEEAKILNESEKKNVKIESIDAGEKIKENENTVTSPSETGLGRFKSLFSFPRRASKSEQPDKQEAVPSEALTVENIAELKAEDEDSIESELTETLVTGHAAILTSEPAIDAGRADAMELEPTEILNAEHVVILDAEDSDAITMGNTEALCTQPGTNYSDDSSEVDDSAQSFVKEIIAASSIIASDDGSIPEDIKDQNVKSDGKAEKGDETSEIEDEKLRTGDEKDKTKDKKFRTIVGQATPKDGNDTAEDGNATEENGYAIVKDGNALAEDGNVITEDRKVVVGDENAISVDGNAIAGDEKNKTEDVTGVAEDMKIENLEDALIEYEKAMMAVVAETDCKSQDNDDKSKGDNEGTRDPTEIQPEDPEFMENYEQTDMSCVMNVATDDKTKDEHDKARTENEKVNNVVERDDDGEIEANDEESKTGERKANTEDETNISEDGKIIIEVGKDKTDDGKPVKEDEKDKTEDGKDTTEDWKAKTDDEKDKTEDGKAASEDGNAIPVDRKATAEDGNDKEEAGNNVSENGKDKTENIGDNREDEEGKTDEGKYKTGDRKDKVEVEKATNEDGKGKREDGKDKAEDETDKAEDGISIPEDGKDKTEDGKDEVEDGKATIEEGKDKTKDGQDTAEDMKIENLEDAIAEYEKAMMELDAAAKGRSEDDSDKNRRDNERATNEITIQPEDPEFMQDYEQTDRSYEMDNQSQFENDEAPDDSTMDSKKPGEIEEELELNQINKVIPKTVLSESGLENFVASPNYVHESNQGDQLGPDSTSVISDDQVKRPRIKKVRFAGVDRFPQESIDQEECREENLIPATCSSTTHETYPKKQLEQQPTTEIEETIQLALRGADGKPELKTDIDVDANSSLLDKDDQNLQSKTADFSNKPNAATEATAERSEIKRFSEDMEEGVSNYNLSAEPNNNISIVADTFSDVTQETTDAANVNETQQVISSDISQDAEMDTLKAAEILSMEPIEDEEIAYKSLNEIRGKSDFNLIVEDKNRDEEEKLKCKHEALDDAGGVDRSYENSKAILDISETLPDSRENITNETNENLPDQNDARSIDSKSVEISVAAASNLCEEHGNKNSVQESSKDPLLPSSEDYTREQDAKESSTRPETTHEFMVDESTEQLKSTSGPVETIENKGSTEKGDVTRDRVEAEDDSLQSNALDRPQGTVVDSGKELNLIPDNSANGEECYAEVTENTVPLIAIDLVKNSDNISNSEQLESDEGLSASVTEGETEKYDESSESQLKEDQIYDDSQAGENAAKKQDEYHNLPEVISEVNVAVPKLDNSRPTSVQLSESEETSLVGHRDDENNATDTFVSEIDNPNTENNPTSSFSPFTDAAEGTMEDRDMEATMADELTEAGAPSINRLAVEMPFTDIKDIENPSSDKIVKGGLSDITFREELAFNKKTEELDDKTRPAESDSGDLSDNDEKANDDTPTAVEIIDQYTSDKNYTNDSDTSAVAQIEDKSTEYENKIDNIKGEAAEVPSDQSISDENKTNTIQLSVTQIVDEAASKEIIVDTAKPAGLQPEDQSTMNANVNESITLTEPSNTYKAADVAEGKSDNDDILATTTDDENLKNIHYKNIADIPLTTDPSEISTEISLIENSTTQQVPSSSKCESEQIILQDRNISTVQLEDETISEESEFNPEILQSERYGNRETLTIPGDGVSTNIEEEGGSKPGISEQSPTARAAEAHLEIISAAQIVEEKLAAEIGEDASSREKINASIGVTEEEKLLDRNLTAGKDETMPEEEGLKDKTVKRKHIPVTNSQQTKENVKDTHTELGSPTEMQKEAHEVDNKDLTLVISPCRIDITDAELDSMVESNKSPDNRSERLLTLPSTEELSINRLENSDNLDAAERRNSLYGSTQSLNSDPVLREMTKLVPDSEELATPSSAAAQQRRLEWLKKKRSPHRSQDGLMEQYDSVEYYFDSPVTSSYEYSSKDSISRDTDDVMIFDRSPLKILWEDVLESYAQIENMQLTIKLQVIKLEECVQLDTETIRLSSIRTRHIGMKERSRTWSPSCGQTPSNAPYSSSGTTSGGRSHNTSNYDEHETPTLAERIKHFTSLASNDQRDISEHKYATVPRIKHGTLRQGSSLEDVHGGASTLPGPKVRIRKLERRPDTSSFTVVEAMDSTDGISTSWISVGDIAGRWKNPQSKSKRSSSGSFGGSGTISEAESRRKEFFSSSKGYRFLDRSVSSNSLDTPSITSSFESTRSQENIERDPLDETLQE